MSDVVLFRGTGDVKIGDVYRYRIEYKPAEDSKLECLYLYVYNTELAALRAAYLNGPFTLYVDMRPEKYDDSRKVNGKSDQPHYNHNLKAGQHFKCELPLHGTEPHVWYVDVVGEQLFSRTAVIKHQLVIGTSKAACKSGDDVSTHPECDAFSVNLKDTRDLWLEPPQERPGPLHLVILTHGLVSNVTADMLYLKEEIDKQALKTGENIICKGYTGNVCRTEQGVKFLGRRVADWIVDEMVPRFKPKKMSFIAHSLGGLIQSYALAYIEATHPGFFNDIELVNFIALASPFLGITTENPGYVKMALDFGFVGKTGRDLGLSWQIGLRKPLLRTLPTGPANDILKPFKHRTVYANAVNDGIVPLRTASLLYLDWRAISKATAAQRGTNAAKFEESQEEEAIHPNTEVASLSERADVEATDKKQKQKLNSQHEKHFKGGSTGSTHTVNSITHTVDQVFQWLNPWAPHKVSKRRIRHYQTNHESDSYSSDGDSNKDVVMPRKTSIFESGVALMIAPLPNSEFIGNPDKREDVIFHDRVYSSKDLPPRRFRKKLFKSHNDPKEIARGEEKMARAWHKDKDWRKVLVQLLPEAHNNIIVRRRFTNAYGWPVVHHVVTKHFGGDDDNDETSQGCDINGLNASIQELQLENGSVDLSKAHIGQDGDIELERESIEISRAHTANSRDSVEIENYSSYFLSTKMEGNNDFELEEDSVDLSKITTGDDGETEMLDGIVRHRLVKISSKDPSCHSAASSLAPSTESNDHSDAKSAAIPADKPVTRADTTLSLASTTTNDTDVDPSWFEPSKSDSEGSSFHEMYM